MENDMQQRSTAKLKPGTLRFMVGSLNPWTTGVPHEYSVISEDRNDD